MANDRQSNKSSRDVIADYLGHETPARIAAEADSCLQSWAIAQAVAIGGFVVASVMRDRDGAVAVSVVAAAVQLLAFLRLARGVVLLVFASARARREN